MVYQYILNASSIEQCCYAQFVYRYTGYIPSLFVLLQPLRWHCVDCVIHHERDVSEEQKYLCAWREQAIATHDLYYCLLPRCEALHTCRLEFPIATKWCCDQDVEVVPSSAFTQRTCDRCVSL